MLKSFYWIVLTLSLLGTLLAALPLQAWWIKGFDVARHYQIVVAIGLFLAAFFLFSFTNWRLYMAVFLLTIVIGLHWYKLKPYTPFALPEVAALDTTQPSIKILSANVWRKNQEYQKFIRLVEQKQPDVILVLELTESWANALSPLESAYPFQVTLAKEHFGIGLYSKLPLQDAAIEFLVNDDIPSVFADVMINATDAIHFVGIHPVPPLPQFSEMEKAYETVIAGSIGANNIYPVILAGDFNEVSWSKLLTKLQQQHNYKNPRVGQFIRNTYKVGNPLFNLPIDHFYLDQAFINANFEVLKSIGSDHYPIWLEVNYQDNATEQTAAYSSLRRVHERETVIFKGQGTRK